MDSKININAKEVIVLDSDLGTDDALALFLLKDLKVKPKYLVSSYGNTTVEGAVLSAILLKKYLGLDIEIVKGVQPKQGTSEEKNGFHGPDGLAGIRDQMLKKYKVTSKELSEYIQIKEFKNELLKYDKITYITIGTLSNLRLLLEDKDIFSRLEKIYVMGGGLEEFNCSHDTEFNFSKDPEDVKILLSCGKEVTLFPLDVTNHQRLYDEQIQSLQSIGSYPEYIEFLKYNFKSNTLYDDIPAAVLHDTLPVLYLSHSDKFMVQDKKIISDEYGHIEKSQNGRLVHVCTSIQDGFVYSMIERSFKLKTKGDLR